MKAFLDTSVLVASFWGDHPQHEASLRVFVSLDKKQASCAAHSLAEVYAVMTRLPVRPAIAPEQAMLFLQNIRERLTIVALTEDDYGSTMRQAAERGIIGGRVYDALLLRCAAKAKAETVYTWNIDHFRRIAPESAEKVRTPG